jgi:hypothetical protein
MAAEIAHWKVEPLVRDRRNWDESLLIRTPWLARTLFARVMALPAGSRSRRSLITRTIRTGIAANNRGDYDAMSVAFHPDVLLRATEETRPPGLDLEHVGPDAYVALLKAWKEPFADFRFETLAVYDGGGARVGARVDAVGHGQFGGPEVRQIYFHAWEIESGMLRRQWVVGSEAEMMELIASGRVASIS